MNIKRYIDYAIRKAIRLRDNRAVVISMLKHLSDISHNFDFSVEQLGWPADGRPYGADKYMLRDMFVRLSRIDQPRMYSYLNENAKRKIIQWILDADKIRQNAAYYGDLYKHDRSSRRAEFNGELKSACLSALTIFRRMLDNVDVIENELDDVAARRRQREAERNAMYGRPKSTGGSFNRALHSGQFAEAGRFGGLDLDSKYW